ncbi:MAG: site-2 protease family protein, partial [Oscillospiraceae bacterium]|nr:site-2 protease family protein [Oscillospiraceae bacterium]
LLLFADAAAFYSPVITGLAPEFESRGEESLMEGDRFYAINGERIYLYSDVALFLERGYGEAYDVTVLRNGEKVILEDLDLKYGEVTSSYSGEKYMGFGFYFGYEEATFFNRISYSWYQAVDFVRLVRLSLGDLFTGSATINDLSGPVGIVSTMTEVGENAETVKDAIGDIAYLAALIAVNLSVMNLLPLPALDGGKILFLAVNSISMLLFKKKVPPKYENYIHTAGLVLLLGLMVVVWFNDIMKLF